MPERVARCYVRLPARPPSGHCDANLLCGLPYATTDDAGTPLDVGLTDIGALPDAGETILILDARDVLLVSLQLPQVTRARLQPVLAGLIEDHLLADPQQSHIAIVHRHVDGHATLAVADHAWLKFLLGAGGKRRTRMLPAQLCIPLAESGTTVVVEPLPGASDSSLLTIRTGAHAGYGIALGMAHASDWIGSRLGSASTYADGAPPDNWPLWITGADALGSIDLCQFDLSPSRRNAASRPGFARWRWAASLTMVALLIGILGINVHWWVLARQQAQMRAEMSRLMLEHFPRVGTVVDAPVQMRQQVAALARTKGQPLPGDLEDLTDRLAKALGPIPSDAITEIQYRNDTLHIRLADTAKVDVDAFRQRLDATGLVPKHVEGQWLVKVRS